MEVLFGQHPLNNCTQQYNQRVPPNSISTMCKFKTFLGAFPQTEPYHFHFYSDAPAFNSKETIHSCLLALIILTDYLTATIHD